MPNPFLDQWYGIRSEKQGRKNGSRIINFYTNCSRFLTLHLITTLIKLFVHTRASLSPNSRKTAVMLCARSGGLAQW